MLPLRRLSIAISKTPVCWRSGIRCSQVAKVLASTVLITRSTDDSVAHIDRRIPAVGFANEVHVCRSSDGCFGKNSCIPPLVRWNPGGCNRVHAITGWHASTGSEATTCTITTAAGWFTWTGVDIDAIDLWTNSVVQVEIHSYKGTTWVGLIKVLLINLETETKLLHVGQTCDPTCTLTCLSKHWEKDGSKDSNDCDNNQQLDECKCTVAGLLCTKRFRQ